MRIKTNFMPFLRARDFARSLGLKSQRAWLEYCKKDRLFNIPVCPEQVYKDIGWTSWMDWLGYDFLRNDRKYTVNDNYFKSWSPNMAYILGFWFADGCIMCFKKSKIFNIAQDKKDKYLLDAILKEMGSNNRLSRCKNCYHFTIVSKTIYDDIIGMGGKERKSLDVKFPKIPKKYLPDFIRGLWDGDGCIFYNKQGKAYVSSYVSGSKKFINGLFDSLRKNIPSLGENLCRRRSNNGKYSYYLQLGRNDTIRLKKFMYSEPLEGKLMLKRKYDLFLKTPDCCSREFIDYSSAQKFIKLLNIKNSRKWRQNCRLGKIPHNIPRCPDQVYKNNGWVDWHTWLGISKNSKPVN